MTLREDSPRRGLNPYQQLIALEQKKIGGRNTTADDDAYRDLVDVLRQCNDDPGIVQNLMEAANILNSEGAAYALRETPLVDVGNRIRSLIRDIVAEAPSSINKYKTHNKHETEDRYSLKSQALPLALAGSTDRYDIDLLCRAALFRRTSSPIHDGDGTFRINAVRALAEIKSERVQETLFSMLCSPEIEPDLRMQVSLALNRNPPKDLYQRAASILSHGRRRAIRSIARLNGCGAFRSTWDSLFRTSRYDRVLVALDSITLGRKEGYVPEQFKNPPSST